MTQSHSLHETAIEATTGALLKSAPPVAVSGMTLAGIQLSDMVLLATLVWISIQAGFFLKDRYDLARKRRREQPMRCEADDE